MSPVSIQVKLVGADTCNRYKRMREIVLDEAARASVEIDLVEENEATGILKYRTVNLPLLFIGGQKIAQGNPPSRKKVQACLRAR
jgi:hypothetical protein